MGPKVGFIPVNLSTRNSTHETPHAEIYQPLTGSSNVSESWKEMTRKSKENSSANVVKWRQSAKRVEWTFPRGQHTLSPRGQHTLSPDFRARGQCIPPSTNGYEYSTKKTPPISSVRQVNTNNFIFNYVHHISHTK